MTSSTAREVSCEKPEWRHGAFDAAVDIKLRGIKPELAYEVTFTYTSQTRRLPGEESAQPALRSTAIPARA